MSLIIRPITLKAASDYIAQYHRHHKPPQGHKFSIACYDGDKLVGVACAGRPVCRNIDQNFTLEVTRLCSDGTKNVCSMCYGRIARIAKEMGYNACITYILEDEPGTSLKAAGWKFDGLTQGGTWDAAKRPRKYDAPTCRKQRWKITFN
jgi:hypothetical protein